MRCHKSSETFPNRWICMAIQVDGIATTLNSRQTQRKLLTPYYRKLDGFSIAKQTYSEGGQRQQSISFECCHEINREKRTKKTVPINGMLIEYPQNVSRLGYCWLIDFGSLLWLQNTEIPYVSWASMKAIWVYSLKGHIIIGTRSSSVYTDTELWWHRSNL